MGQLRLDGWMDVEKFIFRPGKIFGHFLFGPGRQIAQLSANALYYAPDKQQWEKRLTRYLSWQWRIRATTDNYRQPFRVATLFDAVGKQIASGHPNRTRERFEKALDTLHRHRVIGAWQYERWDEARARRRGWTDIWLQGTVVIEPPMLIREAYATLTQPQPTPHRLPQTLPHRTASAKTLGERLRRHRKALGLLQRQAAEQIGIHRGHLSKLEQDKAIPTEETREKLTRWLTH